MSTCHGCGGTGIDAAASPRQAAVAALPILMRRTTGVIVGGGTSNVFRAVLSENVEKRRMYFQGPLILLAMHVEQRLGDGYEIVEGDTPDRTLACRWCNGYGTPEGQLTVHTLEQLARRNLASS